MQKLGTRDKGQGTRRRGDGGYILLALLFGAAVVAIGLALSLPRMAMRAQRVREETLIYRGEQYKRAVQLYFRENKKYPQSLDDLEDTNGVRYLRRRYKDPITGEDEWRLVHMGANGRFKDSLIYDTEKDDPTRRSSGFGSAAGFGSNSRSSAGARYAPGGVGQPGYAAPIGRFDGAARARSRRESAADDPYASRGSQGGPYASQFGVPGGVAAADPNQQQRVGPDGRPLPPDYSRALPSQVPYNAGQRPPQTAGVNPPANLPGGRAPAGFAGSAFPQGGVGGFGAFAGLQQQPGERRPPQSGQTPAAFGREGVGSQAASIIQRLLTTPRPGGLAGIRPQTAAIAAQQQRPGFSEGIAGVASKAEQFGVKVYKGRERYSEWEFVYDYRQDSAMGALTAGMGAAGRSGGARLPAGQPGVNTSGTLGARPGSATAVPGGLPGAYSIPYQLPPTVVQPIPAGASPTDARRGGFGLPGASSQRPTIPRIPGAPISPFATPGRPPQPQQQPQQQPAPRTGRQLPSSRFGPRPLPPAEPQPKP